MRECSRRFVATVMAAILLAAVCPVHTFALNATKTVDSGETTITEQKNQAEGFWESISDEEEKCIGMDKASYMQYMFECISAMEITCNEKWDDSDTFAFELSSGMPCIYDYDVVMREKKLDGDGDNSVTYTDYGTENTKSTELKNVCLIGPYYGYDSSFTNYYSNLASSIAQRKGGSKTQLTGTSATPAAIRARLASSQDIAVIFDSHGVSGNGTSYLCVRSSDGITGTDTANHWAASLSSGVYGIDGRFMTNNGSTKVGNGMCWFAICEGMMTNGICRPFIDAGAACVYGYSKSVTFSGDYAYAGAFWNKMLDGYTVADAAAYMKAQCGVHDNSSNPAYPIFVSDVDIYPSNVNTTQNVRSTWTLDGSSIVRISYDGNGGKGLPDEQVCEIAEGEETVVTKVSEAVPWKFPYTFGGWAESSTGVVKYQPGDTVELSDNTVLYAIWRLSEYVYENTSSELSVSCGNTNEYRQFVPSATAMYSFAVDASGVLISLYSQQNNVLATGSEMNIELTQGTKYYVCFTSQERVNFALDISNELATEYSISYNPNGGDSTIPMQTGAADYTITSLVPARFPYNFMGWATTPDSQTAQYHSGDIVTPTQDMTLYAVWAEAQTLSETANNVVHFDSDSTEEYRKIVCNETRTYIISAGSECILKLYDSQAKLLLETAEISTSLVEGSTYYVLIPNTGEDLMLSFITENSMPTETPSAPVSEAPSESPTGAISETPTLNYSLGDANTDGTINTGDAVILLRHIAGLTVMSKEQLICANAFPDDAINTADAVQILRYASGMITEFK